MRMLSANTIASVLVQAVLASPTFTAHWRWNLGRALTVLRYRGGRRNPPPIQRMEVDDLMAAIERGEFREDLLFRLNTVEIPLPPLRERREDIPVLAAHCLQQHAHKYRRDPLSLTPTAITALMAYPWPGNIRELDHVLERSVLMTDSNELDIFDLELVRRTTDDGPPLTLDEAERRVIQTALRHHDGNVTEAARELGISRSALYRRLPRNDP